MAEQHRGRAAFKLVFWAAAAAGLMFTVARSYTSGQMAAWFYHTAAVDGYAVNADTFMDATKERPVLLQVASVDRIEGPIAVLVKKGDRLPANANGLIAEEVIKKGERAVLEGSAVRVSVPWQVKEAKGFKYKDTFKHKGVKTYPWAAVWNVLITLGLGLTLGLMAEGLTDLVGLKFDKIRHFEGH